MKNTFNGWSNVDIMNFDAVVDLIMTGHTADQMRPDEWLFKYLEDDNKPLTILDFGCGVGRNSFGLATLHPNWKIIGYDSEQMISRVPEYANINYNGKIPINLSFISDWEYIKQYKFDRIICIIVLQHIKEYDLGIYLNDFKNMTNFLLVSGRRFNDDVKNRSVWTILEENGFYPEKFMRGNTIIPYNAEGNPEDHNTALYKI